MCACVANTGQAAPFGGLGVAQRSLRFQRAHTSLAKEPQLGGCPLSSCCVAVTKAAALPAII